MQEAATRGILPEILKKAMEFMTYETGQRTEYTSIDAVAYLNKIGLKIYTPDGKGGLRLLHTFIPEGATQVVYLYHAGVHFQALIPRGCQ